MFVADAFTGFLNIVILVATLIAILMSWDYLNRADIHRGEYYVLALLSSAGAMFMVAANDLIVVFVALELLSIPLYILAAFRSVKNDGSDLSLKSEESGMKYFILGAFSSAFLVFGAALVYGATGTTNIPQIFSIAGGIIGGTSVAAFYLLIGTALLVVGLGFKVAVVPFHMWTPDVYEGAPTPVTALMSVTAKIGGFAALLRVLVTGLSVLILAEGDPRCLANYRDDHRHTHVGAGQLRGDFAAEPQANAGVFVDRSRRLHHGGGGGGWHGWRI